MEYVNPFPSYAKGQKVMIKPTIKFRDRVIIESTQEAFPYYINEAKASMAGTIIIIKEIERIETYDVYTDQKENFNWHEDWLMPLPNENELFKLMINNNNNVVRLNLETSLKELFRR